MQSCDGSPRSLNSVTFVSKFYDLRKCRLTNILYFCPCSTSLSNFLPSLTPSRTHNSVSFLVALRIRALLYRPRISSSISETYQPIGALSPAAFRVNMRSYIYAILSCLALTLVCSSFSR